MCPHTMYSMLYMCCMLYIYVWCYYTQQKTERNVLSKVYVSSYYYTYYYVQQAIYVSSCYETQQNTERNVLSKVLK
jgi:ABC-type uncharacterized transport system permease subunit